VEYKKLYKFNFDIYNNHTFVNLISKSEFKFYNNETINHIYSQKGMVFKSN